MQTTLTDLIKERGQTYSSIARRTGLQARTVRMIATGETPMDRVSVGTVRQLAVALGGDSKGKESIVVYAVAL